MGIEAITYQETINKIVPRLQLLTAMSTVPSRDEIKFKSGLHDALCITDVNTEHLHTWLHGLFEYKLGYRDWRAPHLLDLHNELFPNCDFRGGDYIFE